MGATVHTIARASPWVVASSPKGYVVRGASIWRNRRWCVVVLVRSMGMLDHTHAEEEELRKLFRHKVGQAQNLEALRQKKATVSARVEVIGRQLPGKSEMDALLSEINQAGTGRGLQFELFKPEQLRLRPYYAELPIAIKLVGNYHSLAGFVSDIANLPRVVTIDHLVLNQQKEGALSFEAVVHTYRYLDKEEANEQAKRLLTSQKKTK